MAKASTTEQSHSPHLCTGLGTLGKAKASGEEHWEPRQRGEGCSHEVAVVVCTYDKPRVPDTPERVKCLVSVSRDDPRFPCSPHSVHTQYDHAYRSCVFRNLQKF